MFYCILMYIFFILYSISCYAYTSYDFTYLYIFFCTNQELQLRLRLRAPPPPPAPGCYHGELGPVALTRTRRGRHRVGTVCWPAGSAAARRAGGAPTCQHIILNILYSMSHQSHMHIVYCLCTLCYILLYIFCILYWITAHTFYANSFTYSSWYIFFCIFISTYLHIMWYAYYACFMNISLHFECILCISFCIIYILCNMQIVHIS
jgi:hypothetical protein